MALSDLLDVFERDTDGEIRAITSAGAGEAARIVRDAEHAAAERIAAALATYRAQRVADADAELSAAIRSARQRVLVARAAMLERLRVAIANELPARYARDPELATVLEEAARSCAGSEAIELTEAPTGTVLELASGTRIDATLDAVLARAWPRLACEALERVR